MGEENPLSTTQLINYINDEYVTYVHRTTITNDIAILQEFGLDIVNSFYSERILCSQP